MLDVEPWFYTLADELRWRSRGWLSEPPSYGRAILLEVLESESARVVAEAAQRQREMQESRARARSHTGVR